MTVQCRGQASEKVRMLKEAATDTLRLASILFALAWASKGANSWQA